MRIAVTYDSSNGQVFQHFGHTEQFKIYNVEDKVIVNSLMMPALGSGHGALAQFLSAARVDVLICGGIGGGARAALTEAGIMHLPGVVGDADKAVEAYLNGSLRYNPNTVCAHHDHGEGHTCGDHGCGDHEHSCGGHCGGHH